MNRLVVIGFIKVGYWTIHKFQIKFQLSSHQESTKVLYSFVSKSQILYIGKTTKTLVYRMRGYQNPGLSQRTNIHVNDKIKNLLEQGLPLDIYILPNSGLLKYGDFNLSIAGGLEDTLINEINPEWNITGKPTKNTISKTIANKKSIIQKESQNGDSNTFEVILWSAYYSQGFFNVRRGHSNKFGENKEIIKIQLGDNPNNYVHGVIDRTANTNGTPRIRGRKPLTEWIRNNFNQGDILVVEIISPTSIRLRKKSKVC